MPTVNRIIQSDQDRTMAARLVENRPYPFTLTVTDGKPRSNAQNRLQHMWMKEISEQKGDCTPEEARAYCKLTIGVPILRSQNEAFKERYDEILKPLSYEQKLAIMSEPLNLPVTSLMSTKQLTEYLEAIIRHFGEQGIVLTMPEDLRDQINHPGDTPSTPDAEESPAPSANDEPEDANSPALSSGSFTLLDCANEMLALATSQYENDAERDAALGQCIEQWEQRLPNNRPSTDKISVAVRAIITKDPAKRRTIDQARSWLSDELHVSVQDLGGAA